MREPHGDRYLALKAMMMPRDENPYGMIFGGAVLSYIDQAGAIGATHEIRAAGWPNDTIVTVAMDAVEFHTAVIVGEVVSFLTRLVHVGTTSITMKVEVETERNGGIVKLTEATVTYVAMDMRDGKLLPVPIRGDESTDAQLSSNG